MDFIEPCFGIGHNLSLICQMTSEDIKHQLIIIILDVLDSLNKISVFVSVSVFLPAFHTMGRGALPLKNTVLHMSFPQTQMSE